MRSRWSVGLIRTVSRRTRRTGGTIVLVGASADASRSKTIDRPELELPARIRAARRLAEIDVADDADVAVRGEVRVVEQVEHVGSDLEAVVTGQRERACEGEIRVPDRGAARGVPPFGSGGIAGPRGDAVHLCRAGQ